MAEPTNEEMKALMEKMVKEVDHDTITVKKFTKLLSKEFGGIPLGHRSKFIKDCLTDILNSIEDHSEEEQDESSEEEEEEEEAPVKKARKAGSGGGLKKVKDISDELAALLGKGKQMARTEVVKEMWNYIRDNDLQNPENRREILLDDRMQHVFGVDKFTMFTLNKYVSAHMDPFTPVDLTTNSTATKRKKGSPKKQGKKKPRKSGHQTPYQLSPELARVTGKQILPRPQVTKALWVYIRKHNLQNPDDKREILCDQNLKAVMGGNAKVTMFNMNKHITPHLLEKLDKSYYTHESDDDATANRNDDSDGGEESDASEE